MMKRITETLIVCLWCSICSNCSDDQISERTHVTAEEVAGESAGMEIEPVGMEVEPAGMEIEPAGMEIEPAGMEMEPQEGELDGEGPTEPGFTCSPYRSPITYSELATDELRELSGLTLSGRSPEVLWAHNDSGNDPLLYAIHTSGALIATIELPIPSADLSDLEDIDTAPCPHRANEPCLWIADTGDNAEEREEVRVFIIPEPVLRVDELNTRQEIERLTLDESELINLRFVYEEGPADVEALVVEPEGEALWLFEKVEEREARVWRYVLKLDLIMSDQTPPRLTLSAVTRFASPGVPVRRGRLITAADLSPDALSLALRVYTGVYVYHLPTPSLISALSQLTPELIRLGPLTEPQGEALCYDERGALWSASEVTAETEGDPQVLTVQECSN